MRESEFGKILELFIKVCVRPNVVYNRGDRYRNTLKPTTTSDSQRVALWETSYKGMRGKFLIVPKMY